MNLQFYFRQSQDTLDEFQTCSSVFKTSTCRTNLIAAIPTVVCRYSALPFNRELEQDLHNLGLKPINSSSQHSYIADMGWIYDLEGITFPTWERLVDVPGDFPLVVKGKTNSRKFEWNSKMYAENRAQATDIMRELWNDPLIGPQGIVFRKYVPLKTYEIGINGMPMTNEWRCFFYKNTLVAAGFYWSCLDNLSRVDRDSFYSHGLDLAQTAANIVSENADFFVVDVAQGQDGRWWVVEINDGQMSGLSTISAEEFYNNLKKVCDAA